MMVSRIRWAHLVGVIGPPRPVIMAPSFLRIASFSPQFDKQNFLRSQDEGGESGYGLLSISSRVLL